ncbi:response regulator [Novosphingobium sp.]|uniref:response regulator n=1 Tax=Novosphingobium sp. TaxID=1874826 RepID=UPI003B52FBA2
MYHALVAEDEVLIREILCDELTDAGLEVQAFASAEEALALIESGAPIDLLFTDINLSGAMTGWDLGLKAIAIHPGLRVIYATGGSEPPRALSPLERRIMKPFRFTAIVEMLQDLGLAAA